MQPVSMHYHPLTINFSSYSTCVQLKATAADWMGAFSSMPVLLTSQRPQHSLPAGRPSLLNNPVPSKNARAIELAEHCKNTRRRKKKLCLYDLKTFKINLKMRPPLQITPQSQPSQISPIIAQILHLAEKQCQLSRTSLGTPPSDRSAPQRNNLQYCIMAGPLLDHLTHPILCIEARLRAAAGIHQKTTPECSGTLSSSFLGDQEDLPKAAPPSHLPFHSHSPCSLYQCHLVCLGWLISYKI